MLNTVFQFYLDGFRNMRLGRTLWKIILLKLLIMFAVMKVFFFPNVLNTHYDNDKDRAEHVLHNLTRTHSTVSSDEKITSATGDYSSSANSAMEVSRD